MKGLDVLDMIRVTAREYVTTVTRTNAIIRSCPKDVTLVPLSIKSYVPNELYRLISRSSLTGIAQRYFQLALFQRQMFAVGEVIKLAIVDTQHRVAIMLQFVTLKERKSMAGWHSHSHSSSPGCDDKKSA